MSECVGCNEGEGMKEHKQDRNEDGERQEGTKKRGLEKKKNIRLCGDGSAVAAGEM